VGVRTPDPLLAKQFHACVDYPSAREMASISSVKCYDVRPRCYTVATLRGASGPRRVRERVRLSDLTLTELNALGLSSSDALALFALAYRENRPLDEVIAEWKRSNGHTSRLKNLAPTG
jgi:hypothetical protein